MSVDFGKIAPYLRDPLVLIGFFLFIAFLFLRGEEGADEQATDAGRPPRAGAHPPGERHRHQQRPEESRR